MVTLSKPPSGDTDWASETNQNWTDIENTLNSPRSVATGGTGADMAFGAGSIVFAGASGIYGQDSANLFWDDANNRLGIGTNAPSYLLHLVDSSQDDTPQIHVNQASTGDAVIRFAVGSTRSYAIGIDNDDSDVFKISTAASGSAVLGTGDILSVDSTGNILIGGPTQMSVSATDGFLFNREHQGTPTAIPASYPGRVAVAWDGINDILYTYDGGWKVVCTSWEKRQFWCTMYSMAANVLCLNESGSAYVAEGTATALVDSTGAYINYASAAAANSDAGWLAGAYDWTRYELKPIVNFIIKTGAGAADIQTCRIWLGFFSGDPMGSDTPALHFAAFRYAPASDGTVYWRTVTDNASGAPTIMATSAAIVANTRYRLRIDMTDAANIRFFINDVMVSTHTTKLPTAAQNLGMCAELRTLDASARNIRLSRVAGEHK